MTDEVSCHVKDPDRWNVVSASNQRTCQGGKGMNPVIQAMKERRSVRSYKAEPVPTDIIEMLPRCLGWAPGAYEPLVNSLLETEDAVYYSASP